MSRIYNVLEQVIFKVSEIYAPSFALRLMPVGYYYQSDDPTSPAERWGGTWERIEGRVLLGACEEYPVGSVGGESEVTLTIDGIPRHAHQHLTSGTADDTTNGTYANHADWSEYSKKYGYGYNTTFAGGSKPHNNMPPYIAVYVWRRIA